MRFCIAVGCGKTHLQHNVRICSFPADQQRCDEWIEACGRTDFRGWSAQKLHRSTSFGLCELHFTDSQWSNPMYKPSGLKADAVPTEFNVEPAADGTVIIPHRRPYKRRTGEELNAPIQTKRPYRRRKKPEDGATETVEIAEKNVADDGVSSGRHMEDVIDDVEPGVEKERTVTESTDKVESLTRRTKRNYKKRRQRWTNNSSIIESQVTDSNMCDAELSDCVNALTSLNSSDNLYPSVNNIPKVGDECCQTSNTMSSPLSVPSSVPLSVPVPFHPTLERDGKPDRVIVPLAVHHQSALTDTPVQPQLSALIGAPVCGARSPLCSVTIQQSQLIVDSNSAQPEHNYGTDCNPILLQLQFKLNKTNEQKQYLLYQLRTERSKNKRLEKRISTLTQELKLYQQRQPIG